MARQIAEERRRKELKMLESNMAVELKQAVAERQELESKLQETGHAMLEDCKAELLKEQAQQGAVQEEYRRELGEEVGGVDGE